MSACMITATIVVPDGHTEKVDFAAGHRMLDTVRDVYEFGFDDLADEIDVLLPNLDPNIDVVDDKGAPILKYARQAGHQIIDNLPDALYSSETDVLGIAGFAIFISAGLSYGDLPTDAAEKIIDAHKLPDAVLEAMGFVVKVDTPATAEGDVHHG